LSVINAPSPVALALLFNGVSHRGVFVDPAVFRFDHYELMSFGCVWRELSEEAANEQTVWRWRGSFYLQWIWNGRVLVRL
jgi:hypothetical protein